MLQQFRSAAKWMWIVVAVAFIGGFLLAETSGLLGRTPITPTTAVAVVNGDEILYRDFETRAGNQIQQAQQQGRSLSKDDELQIRNSVFDEMVTDILLAQEYRRRGIIVTDEEVRQYALSAPPPFVMQAPDFQTEGRFDPAKYQRFLSSPAARQQGFLAGLESYYRTEIPRQKLFDEIAAGVYVTDAELWRLWRDQHDSAQVTYVSFRPTAADTTAARAISDGDLRAYFDAHKARFKRQGRAVLSVLEIPRIVTPADSAAVRAHAVQVRNEILGGAKFEDVARRESADSASGAQGGDLGRGPRGRFIPEFETAAYALRPGQVSEPVLTQFGYHLIKVDDRKGDTIAVRHILFKIQPSDSSTTATDRRADSLSRIAANQEIGSRLDSAAKVLHLIARQVVAFEGAPASFNGRRIPSVSAWAFSGPKTGETSDLFDDDNGYYIARLDSITPGGDPKFDDVKEDVRQVVAYNRELDALTPKAQQLATAAAASTLEAAAQAQKMTTTQTAPFTRSGFVPGLGQFTAPIGEAFGLPIGAIGTPVRTDEAVFVLRVDRRTPADSAAFTAQKPALRQQQLQRLRQQRVSQFLDDLKKAAKIKDRRKDIEATARRTSV